MNPDFQRRIQRYGWDRAAAVYEDYWQRQLAPAQRRLLEMAELQPGERVVEMASGTGLVTFPAAEAVAPDGYVVATDISDEMVRRLEAEARDRGLDNVRSARMDAEALDVDDESFDVALCALGLMYVPEPITALGEMHRALAPGGRAVTAVWGKRSNCGWAEVFPIVDRRVESDVCPLFFQLGTGEMMALSMDEAGFDDVEVDRITTSLIYETDDEACAAVFAAGPVALAYRRFDDETRREAHEEYLESIQPYRNGHGYELPGEFVIARAWKRS